MASRRPSPSTRQIEVLDAYLRTGSCKGAAAELDLTIHAIVSHLARMRAASGLTTEQLIYVGASDGWLVVRELQNFVVAASG